MNLTKHTLKHTNTHTFGSKSSVFFRLDLIVVILVRGFPGLVRASPSLFSDLGCFAGVRSTIGFGFSNTISASIRCSFVLSSDEFCRFVIVVVVVVDFIVFADVSRLVAPNPIKLITLHLTAHALSK